MHAIHSCNSHLGFKCTHGASASCLPSKVFFLTSSCGKVFILILSMDSMYESDPATTVARGHCFMHIASPHHQGHMQAVKMILHHHALFSAGGPFLPSLSVTLLHHHSFGRPAMSHAARPKNGNAQKWRGAPASRIIHACQKMSSPMSTTNA
jgi:hypothetical protein